MIYYYTFLFYSIFSSVVLIYGVGLNKIAEIGIVKFKDKIFYVKCAISIISSSVISWLITYYLLVPLKITELYPLVCFIVYSTICTFLGGIIRLTGRTPTEFAISYLVILLSITESSSLLFTLFISLCSLLSMLIIIPFSLTFRRRVCSNGRLLDEKYYSLYFLFLAVLILLLSVWDIVWLNPEVIK